MNRVMVSMNKKQRIVKHNEQMLTHFEGIYAPEKKKIVFGDGDPRARIVLIGEAPGEQEALQGKPFVGKAGKILDDFLEKTEIRREDIYITNVVKLRPTAISKAGRTVNRAPSKEEIALFRPWLQKELELVEPEYIVTLGNVALKAMTDKKNAVIGDFHGKIYSGGAMGAHLFPLYHPAAVIYNRALKEIYEGDLETLRLLLRRG